MSLPDAFKDELRLRVPLSDVIGKRMKLIRAGREFKGCCPFHKEKSPSFYVNDQKGFYHCFGCGAHGDVIGFLMDHDNMSFMDAIEYLAGQAGMQVPKQTPEEEQKYKQQSSLYELMEAAAAWYEQQLREPAGKAAVRYLKDRGITGDTARSFRLGYAPGATRPENKSGAIAPEGNGLKDHLLKKGFKLVDILEAGLVKRSTRNESEVYPFFRDRVIYPVQNIQGRVVAFGARVLPGADKDAPKYINSPETAIFHKGRGLYGLSRARKAIGDGETAIVVEGYMDVISLAQAGFKAAVAPLGTALTEMQIQELWKAMPEDKRAPVLCFDGDAAGQRAAARALERALPILKPAHTVRFAFLTGAAKDPDELIRTEGFAAMERVVKNAIGLFDMLWQEAAKGFDLSQPEAKAGFRAALEKQARLIADGSVQQFFLHEVKQKISETFLSTPAGSGGQQRRNGRFVKGKILPPDVHSPYRPPVSKARPVSKKNAQGARIRILLALMIHYPGLYDDFGEDFGMIEIPEAEYDQLRQDLIHLLTEQNSLDYQAVKQHLMGLGHGQALESIFDSSLYLHANFARPDQPFDIVRQAWQDVWARSA